MDARKTWLYKQPTYWLGVAVTVAGALIAFGIVPDVGTWHRVIAAFISVCNQYGVTAAHLKDPPRVPLIDMSPSDRALIFKQHPEVEARFYVEHPELMPLGYVPPALPPPPKVGA